MTNPEVELRDYLDTLIKRFFLYIVMLNDELKILNEWFVRKPEGLETLNIGASFFQLVQRSFRQTLLIELCKFIDSEKSLKDFLTKARECAEPLKSSTYNIDTGKREIIPISDYIEIIDEHLTKLNSHGGTTSNLKSRRDKELAHTDSSFFNNPQKLLETYLLFDDDIDELLETISEILREHGVYLFGSDMDLKTVYTIYDIGRVLQFVRAFNRAQKDKSLEANGIYASKYKWDDYKKDEI